MIRLGMTLGIKEEKIEEYKKLHANVWPEVLENLTELNFKNYSCLLYTSPSPRDAESSRMPSSA